MQKRCKYCAQLLHTVNFILLCRSILDTRSHVALLAVSDFLPCTSKCVQQCSDIETGKVRLSGKISARLTKHCRWVAPPPK